MIDRIKDLRSEELEKLGVQRHGPGRKIDLGKWRPNARSVNDVSSSLGGANKFQLLDHLS